MNSFHSSTSQKIFAQIQENRRLHIFFVFPVDVNPQTGTPTKIAQTLFNRAIEDYRLSQAPEKKIIVVGTNGYDPRNIKQVNYILQKLYAVLGVVEEKPTGFITEAQAGYEYALSAGIPKEDLWIDHPSRRCTNTPENIYSMLNVLRDRKVTQQQLLVDMYAWKLSPQDDSGRMYDELANSHYDRINNFMNAAQAEFKEVLPKADLKLHAIEHDVVSYGQASQDTLMNRKKWMLFNNVTTALMLICTHRFLKDLETYKK